MSIDNGKELLSSPPDVWVNQLAKYDSVIEKVSKSSFKKGALAMLDDWKTTLTSIVGSRNPLHLTKEELSKLMRWKLLRGKVRARLQEYIDEITEQKAEEFTKNAFLLLKKGDLSSAIDVCSSIRGIGPAFSTAILSIVDPSVAFMSDEALNVVLGSRKYVKSEALELTARLRKIALSVNSNFTASSCEKAIFSACNEAIVDNEDFPSKKRARLTR